MEDETYISLFYFFFQIVSRKKRPLLPGEDLSVLSFRISVSLLLYHISMWIGKYLKYHNTKCFSCLLKSTFLLPIIGIGYAQALASWAVVTYYSSIVAIALFYFVMSFQSVLPWSVCNPDWADLSTCIEVNNMAINGTNGTVENSNSTANVTLQTSAEQYFKYEICKFLYRFINSEFLVVCSIHPIYAFDHVVELYLLFVNSGMF